MSITTNDSLRQARMEAIADPGSAPKCPTCSAWR